MDDLLKDFLTETAESLEVVDNELVRFEQEPSDKATLNNIFRLVHTIKGTCGFLALPRLEAVAHAGETLLGKFRDGALPVTPAAVTLILESIDRIKELLAYLEGHGVEPNGDDRDIIMQLEDAAMGRLSASAAPAVDAPVVPEGPAPFDEQGNAYDYDLGRYLRPGEVTLAALEAAFRMVDGPVPDPLAAPPPPKAVAEVKVEAKPEARPEARAAIASGSEDEDGLAGGKLHESALAAQSIRVNVDVLEDLMTLVSELVLTRNQLLQMNRVADNTDFKGPLARLSNITAELQDSVMKTRMQPIGNAWKKLPRIVRDTSRDVGKKIDLIMEGDSTELDRQVLELIKDPLTHMVRNSCDHGVEKPADRLAAGKSETGTIRLKAYHEGGRIIIEISDDGAGLKTDRIREKALEKGVITPAEAEQMSDAQIQRLIFAPGFSTAAAVTNLSGRGVGMDVVRTNIELIGGVIDLKSVEGQGTVFYIRIPLTLAIMSALVVGAGGQRFALPQLAVVELVRAGDKDHPIETINKAQVFRLRDRLLPLVDLSENLGLDTTSRDGPTRFVVVVQVGAQPFGVIVDEVFDTEEIVVKPLASMLRGHEVFSGATILGDGAVIMILDQNALARFVANQDNQTRKQGQEEAAAETGPEDSDQTRFLVFRAGGAQPKAAPLSLITRLEDLDATTFEISDEGFVVQYRGALMSVVHMAGPHAMRREGRQPVLVFHTGARPLGVAVDEIVDIVHDRLNVELASHTPGILGSAVLKGQATEIIDVAYFLNAIDRDWARPAREEKVRSLKRVLVVEANPFFRNLLTPLLQSAGYEVATAAGVEAAQRIRERGLSFDAILSDLDHNAEEAAEFGAGLVHDPLWGPALRIAMSGAPEDAPEAAQLVFGACVAKTDRASLIATLAHGLNTRNAA